MSKITSVVNYFKVNGSLAKVASADGHSSDRKCECGPTVTRDGSVLTIFHK